jgi:hypothetical protein
MSGTDVTLTDLLEQQLANTLQAMAGPAYGVVETYNPATERASISPLVPLKVDGDVIASPKLPSVPVVWPSSTTHSDKWPLVDAAGVGNGSLVELVPLGHDHNGWITTGTPDVPPVTERRFSLADLVAKPLSPSPLATPPNPLSYDAAWRVLFGPTVVGDNTGTLVALASLVLTELQSIATWADNHSHGPGTFSTVSGPVTGQSTTPTKLVPPGPDPVPPPSSVACTQLKAK